MNAHPILSEALQRSSICYYCILTDAGKILQANDLLFSTFYPTLSALSAADFASIIVEDPKQPVAALLSHAINCANEMQRTTITMRLPDNDTIAVDWEIIACKREGDADAYIECIGITSTTITNAEDAPITEHQLEAINSKLLCEQKERTLMASILRSLSTHELMDDALKHIIKQIAIYYRWSIGEVWLISEDKTSMNLSQTWLASLSYQSFYTPHPHITSFDVDNKLGGLAWQKEEVTFFEKLENNENFLRKQGAASCGIHYGLGVPVKYNGNVIAIFCFFYENEIQNKAQIKSFLEALSFQLGLELQRKMTEQQLNILFNICPEVLTIFGFDGYIKKANPALVKLLGYSEKELLERPMHEFWHPDDKAASLDTHKKLLNHLSVNYFENRYKTKQGDYKWLSWAATTSNHEKMVYATAKDITDDKQQNHRINHLLESISDAFFALDKSWKILYWNNRAEDVLLLKRDTVIGKTLGEALPGSFAELEKPFNEAFNTQKNIQFETRCIIDRDTWFDVNAYAHDGMLSVFFKDITERKKNRELLGLSSERFDALAKATNDAIWDWNLVTQETVWNDGVNIIFNYTANKEMDRADWWYQKIHPEDRQRVSDKINRHIEQHTPQWQDEYRFRCADGSYKYIFDRGFTIYDSQNNPVRMIGAMQDLSERKSNELILKDLNSSLQKRAAELAASNTELERFAYVASHDLQEPLRMVSSFLQLIEKRYKDKLDQKAHEYIRFAVDGAERMKVLILDLLEYSRVNARKEAKVPVDLNDIATTLLITYKARLEETDGIITIDPLPVVDGIRIQLLQLLQNLVSNAIKYKSDKPTQIHIGYRLNNNFHEFSVKDNGIGIEPRFFNKIFIIFQRLHNKNDYSGTGIGLAICKKIVELHGGSIWVNSAPGNGSTFYFTLPKLPKF